MAEAMELDLTLKESTNNPLENPIVPPLGTLENKENESIPSQFTIQKYYDNDTLGSDVLKQKYLAPWEEHPYQMWIRQANALASVEKTKKLREEWEKKFFSILEDFRFVPG